MVLGLAAACVVGCGERAQRPRVRVEAESDELMSVTATAGGGSSYRTEASRRGGGLADLALLGGAGGGGAVPALNIFATEAQAAPVMDTVRQQLMRNAWLNIEVTSAETALDSLEDIVTGLGGYISSQEINEQHYGETKRKRAHAVLRVPAGGTDTLLLALHRLGNVKSERVWSEDVTEEYYDTHIRLQNARETRTQLESVLRTARTVEDILSVRRELSRVTEEIERSTGRLRRLTNRINLATITVDLREPVPVMEDRTSSIGKVATAFGDMVDVFWETIAGMIVLFGALLPVGVVITLCVWIIIRLVRRWRKRRKEKETAEPGN